MKAEVTSVTRIAVVSQDFVHVGGKAGRARRFLVFDVGADGKPVLSDTNI